MQQRFTANLQRSKRYSFFICCHDIAKLALRSVTISSLIKPPILMPGSNFCTSFTPTAIYGVCNGCYSSGPVGVNCMDCCFKPGSYCLLRASGVVQVTEEKCTLGYIYRVIVVATYTYTAGEALGVMLRPAYISDDVAQCFVSVFIIKKHS